MLCRAPEDIVKPLVRWLVLIARVPKQSYFEWSGYVWQFVR